MECHFVGFGVLRRSIDILKKNQSEKRERGQKKKKVHSVSIVFGEKFRHDKEEEAKKGTMKKG